MMQLHDGILPHGGELIDRQLGGEELVAAFARVEELIKVPLTAVNAADVEMIATGAYSPLTGFMGQADYEFVLKEMRLANGLVWSLPITLPVDDERTGHIMVGGEVALEQGGRVIAIMQVQEKFRYDKEREARLVYQTTDERHPGVVRLYDQGDTLLAGEINLLSWPTRFELPDLPHMPQQTRQIFNKRCWQKIVGFQTRNPLHRAHEYILKHALESVDGLLLHPIAGQTKADDIPVPVRIKSYKALLKNYFPVDRTLLSLFPAPMRFAGPREAIFHAICRKNYGCTHFIIGRDHAGINGFYAPDAAHEIFTEFKADEIGIQALFYQPHLCVKCGGVVTAKTCPHENDSYNISGSEIRAALTQGQMPSPDFMRPEVSQVLIDGLRPYRQTG